MQGVRCAHPSRRLLLGPTVSSARSLPSSLRRSLLLIQWLASLSFLARHPPLTILPVGHTTAVNNRRRLLRQSSLPLPPSLSSHRVPSFGHVRRGPSRSLKPHSKLFSFQRRELRLQKPRVRPRRQESHQQSHFGGSTRDGGEGLDSSSVGRDIDRSVQDGDYHHSLPPSRSSSLLCSTTAPSLGHSQNNNSVPFWLATIATAPATPGTATVTFFVQHRQQHRRLNKRQQQWRRVPRNANVGPGQGTQHQQLPLLRHHSSSSPFRRGPQR